MSDQLRERFDALRDAAEHGSVHGLHDGGLRDVHARRTRRTRNRVAVATAATVGALALGGVLVVPQLQRDNATSAGGAQVLSNEARGQADNGVGAEQAPVGTDPTVPPAQDSATVGPFAVTSDSLLTWADIQAAGESGPGTVPNAATLVFPGLCGAENAYAEYSGPDEVVAKAWLISDGVLTQSDLQYASDQQAADALARLGLDAQACPTVNEFASIAYVGSDATVGTEIAFFDMRVESGQDGSISTVEISVTRIANVLVEVVFQPDGSTVTDADNRSRAVAGAAVNRVVVTG